MYEGTDRRLRGTFPLQRRLEILYFSSQVQIIIRSEQCTPFNVLIGMCSFIDPFFELAVCNRR
jgi:hypothetical protein